MSSSGIEKDHGYVPPPSTRHELGVMFGFMGILPFLSFPLLLSFISPAVPIPLFPFSISATFLSYHPLSLHCFTSFSCLPFHNILWLTHFLKAIFLVVIVTYYIGWQVSNKRSQKQERESVARVREMEARGASEKNRVEKREGV